MTIHTDFGAANGHVRTVLRLEGIAVLLAATALYFGMGGELWFFALLLFAPDLSFLAYIMGSKAGAIIYNIAHNYIAPVTIGATGILFGIEILQHLALIHLAHIGLDRSLGYGLKYASGFKHTHLGALGKSTAAKPVSPRP